MKTKLLLLAGAGLSLLSVPALAQDAVPPPSAIPDPETADPRGDFTIVGVGAGILPNYEGSDDYGFSPVPAAIGQIEGFRYSFLGNRLSVDLIRDGYGPTVDLQAGPIGVIGFNRTSADAIDDPQVALLDERNTAIELGGYVGIGKTGVLTSDYDRLSATISYRYDVAGAHDSGILTPTVAYTTPLSTKALVGLFLSAERVENGYGDAYFSVSAAESLRSGLPVYDADGGWKNYTIGFAGAHSLTGDLTGGLQMVVGGTYRRLLGDFSASPVTAIAGSPHQWLGTVGLAYSF
ncbi:MipA/OmpV family protein [Sphingomonas qomolangmaensis]|uniref:MipA/OmpV family protein n=1 Tax=Sphingomonas qomolangmaensis TaxID=2918765 RepID=A0ABY5L833_9SPHN|nr:MipA/OmpV family protein [Sphingomonas qomolangmaensis]UUL81900.1 MipA/OmpV family protein [Sphingomonas qomolangmaensis]